MNQLDFEIEHFIFGIDMNNNITYNENEITGHPHFYKCYCYTKEQLDKRRNNGMSIYIYKNKERADGLWWTFYGHEKGEELTGVQYTYRAVCIERRANNNKSTNNKLIPYNMKKVKAIFRGQDGSCGFQTGREYTLHN